MIAWVRDLLVEHVIAPQAAEPLPYTTTLDPDSAPLDTEPNEFSLLEVSSTPISQEIGSGIEVSHVLDLALSVAHGEPAEARKIRDRVVLDLIRRLLAAKEDLYSAVDPVTGQTVTRVVWSVSYVPLTLDTPNEEARVTFTVETALDG